MRWVLIEYVTGDATKPVGDGPKIIAHVVNNLGLWGAGFVLAVSRRWRQPETSYLAWRAGRDNFELGQVQFVMVEENLWVANMIAQSGIRNGGNTVPLSYCDLQACLREVARFAKSRGASVHAPRIGCGLGGGKWATVERIIKEELISQGISTTIYDFSS